MITCAPVCTWRHRRARRTGWQIHPDTVFLGQMQEAVDWWAGQTPDRPTSSITGGGAIATTEALLSSQVGGRPVVALPNATFGLRIALSCLDVQPGDEVLISGLDWPAARAAVLDTGARPVPLPVLPGSLTADPDAAYRLRGPRTRAAIVTHLHGLCADVPRLRKILGGDVPIIEDAAQALGSTLDGRPAGTLGDLAVFSLGPGKIISAGELGLLVTCHPGLFRRALRLSQHPVRQMLAGIGDPTDLNLAGRASPHAAVLAARKLSAWPGLADRLRRVELQLRWQLHSAGLTLLGNHRQRCQPGRIPILAGPAEAALVLLRPLSHDPHAGVQARWVTSGCQPCPGLSQAAYQQAADLARRVRVLEISLTDQAGEPR